MSTSTEGNGRSAAEIERDVERSRARLVDTAETLKSRVSPGQMTEQAMDWLRGSGGREFIGNLGTRIRDNPIPVLLVTAGIAWLAFNRNDGDARASSWRSYDGSSTEGDTSYRASSSSGQDSGPSLTEKVSETASSIRDRASDMAGKASETAREAWDSVTGTAQSVADRASQQVSRAGQQTYSRTSRTLSDYVDAQPLLMGAVGLALGATIGALLPSTETEDQLMGESRERLAEGAQEELRQGTSKLGEMARDLRETVERKAEDLTTPAERPAQG